VSNTVSSNSGFAIGVLNTVVGQGGIAIGEGNTVNGSGGIAVGSQCTADVVASVARGSFSKTTLRGQDAYALNAFSVVGDAQTSILTMTGSTPGAGIGETSELLIAGSDYLILEDGKSYAFRFTVNAGGTIAAVRQCRMFNATASVRRDGGVTTVAGTTVTSTDGDAGTAGWTFVLTGGGGPDRLNATFTTGATQSLTKIIARVEMTEVKY
jgi:hypothetical protein